MVSGDLTSTEWTVDVFEPAAYMLHEFHAFLSLYITSNFEVVELMNSFKSNDLKIYTT